jgi:hypothetical protein
VTFLPIVDRELRVAARKRNTFWLRVVAALIALIIGGGFMMLSLLPFGGAGPFGGRGQMGGPLFAVLTWLSLGTALCAGLFFTSDCVSEEKREGTLGFLFLTDLHGYDVVLGKLLATSLRCVFGLVAIFPVLAVTQLMGGVDAAQFWKTLLALVNALFVSLAGGLFVSAISRDSQKALGGTLLFLLLCVFGGPIADGTMAAVQKHSFRPALSLASPGYVFLIAGRGRDPTFWPGLLTNQVIVWTLMGVACALVPRTWQQRRTRGTGSQRGWSYAWRYGGVKRRAALRQKLMSRSPVLWLACRERWQSVMIWAVTILLMAVVVAMLIASFTWDASFVFSMMWGYIGWAFTLLFYLGTASQASQFFVDARRSGLIELLLAAPLSGKEIVQGQWRAMLRLFAAPVILFLCIQLASTALSQQSSWRVMATAAGSGPNDVLMVVTALGGTIVIAANLITLCWFGMWMGMTSKSANLATLKTVLFVQVIPWFVLSFAAGLILSLMVMPTMVKVATGPAAATLGASRMMWFPFLYTGLTVVLSLGKDVFFFVLARRKLYANFRDMAVRAIVPIQFTVPPPPPRLAATPPVIPAQT